MQEPFFNLHQKQLGRARHSNPQRRVGLRVRSFTVFCCLAALGTFACTASDEEARDDAPPDDVPGYETTYEVVDCSVAAPAGRTMTCGVVTVPEDRSDPTGAIVELSVATIHTSASEPLPPLIYLPGGPGGGAIWSLGSADNAQGAALAALAEKRDVVVYDPRGTGSSIPLLACNDREPEADCYARLSETGADFSQYTSAANADDVDDVRRALGYEQWDVLGASYGTRVALELLRRHPGGVRATIIDSVVPAHIDMFAETTPAAYGQLAAALDRCAADADCAAAYPDLESVLLETAASLQASPAMMSLSNGAMVPLDDRMFMGMTSSLVRDTATLPTLPEFVFKVSDGDYSSIMATLETPPATGGGGVANGVYLSVICAEEAPFTSVEQIAAVAEEKIPEAYRPYFVERRLESCASWAVPPADASANAAIASDKPVLILAGTLDAATPPDWSKMAAEPLSQGYYVELPGLSHVTFRAHACAREVIEQFLAEPSTAPAAACANSLSAPPFDIVR